MRTPCIPSYYGVNMKFCRASTDGEVARDGGGSGGGGGGDHYVHVHLVSDCGILERHVSH